MWYLIASIPDLRRLSYFGCFAYCSLVFICCVLESLHLGLIWLRSENVAVPGPIHLCLIFYHLFIIYLFIWRGRVSLLLLLLIYIFLLLNVSFMLAENAEPYETINSPNKSHLVRS